MGIMFFLLSFIVSTSNTFGTGCDPIAEVRFIVEERFKNVAKLTQEDAEQIGRYMSKVSSKSDILDLNNLQESPKKREFQSTVFLKSLALLSIATNTHTINRHKIFDVIYALPQIRKLSSSPPSEQEKTHRAILGFLLDHMTYLKGEIYLRLLRFLPDCQHILVFLLKIRTPFRKKL